MSTRNTVAFFIMLGFFLILLSRMFHLQVTEYEQHVAKSNTNRIKVQPLPPTRGLIFDRNGVLLAKNVPMFMVTVTKEQVKDLDGTLAALGKIIDLTPDDINRFHKRMAQSRRPFESVPIKLRLTEAEIAKIAVNLHSLKGIDIEADLIRHYPLGHHTVHSIGYVGRINSQELLKIDASSYAGTRYIGKNGIEKSYETVLLGKPGHQKVETNARGKILRTLAQFSPTPGKNLTLHLDIPTQQKATQALGNRKGAVVAIEPKTGGVLAMVSTPTFDPNLFVTGIPHSTYQQLNESRARPLFNRSMKGQYPPGSTIKPIIALAGLHYGITNWNDAIDDPGYFQLKGSSHFYRDWKRSGHGLTNLNTAIVESCDTYFYELSHKLTIDRIHDFLTPFGLGRYTNIDIPGERKGILPSEEWKKAHRSIPWYPGETLIAGIGQGFMLTTPLQLAVATAVIANRGKKVDPRLIKTIDNIQATVPLPEAVNINQPQEWENIIDSMKAVVHGPRGTARKIGIDAQYTIAGKTGTSQVLSIKQDAVYDAEKLAEWHRDHALFIAFAPAEAPLIAIAVIIENAGGGGTHAAPVARQVMDTYLLPRLPRQNKLET